MSLDINKLKVGMKIRISENPRISISRFSGRIAKMEMAGKIKTVYSILEFDNAILVRDDRKRKWTIHIDDLREIKSLHLIKPATFDPNQLVL